MDALNVLGLDLALRSTGVCLPDGSTRRIITGDKGGDSRMLIIRNMIRTIVRSRVVHLAVIEDLPRDSFSAKSIGMVHGLVRAELIDARVPYVTVVGATLKAFATDNGRADKAMMAQAALSYASQVFADDPHGDRCDAWWLRMAGLDRYNRNPVATPIPEVQRARLDKVDWPDL